jgi:hypothetical protein
VVVLPRSSTLSKLNQKWSATTLGNSLSHTSPSSTVVLVFVYLLSLHSSRLTLLKQIGATHCKLSVEFMIVRTIHHFLSCWACTASRLYVSSRPFQLLVAHVFSAFPSSNCAHLYFPYTSRLLQKKNYALCVVLMLFELCSLTVGFARASRLPTISALPRLDTSYPVSGQVEKFTLKRKHTVPRNRDPGSNSGLDRPTSICKTVLLDEIHHVNDYLWVKNMSGYLETPSRTSHIIAAVALHAPRESLCYFMRLHGSRRRAHGIHQEWRGYHE